MPFVSVRQVAVYSGLLCAALLPAGARAPLGFAGPLATRDVHITQRADSPVAVRLNLDREQYAPGSEGQVRIEVGRTGYLLVLYADPFGHVRVAFPLDPADPSGVKRDTVLDIRARGGRSAFIVDDSTGVGTWYAAISTEPFHLESIAVGDHWDYRVIPRVESPANAERELTNLVESIQQAKFEYDIVAFRIGVDSLTSALEYPSAWPNGPEGPGTWGPPSRGWGGPWFPGPWWTEPHWAGPFYDREVAGVGTASASSGAGPATDVARVPKHPKAPAGSGGGGPPGQHPHGY
jgi:hypothetical protein